MKLPKRVRLSATCLALALLSLTSCASSGGTPLKQLAIACQQVRDAPIPDWPEAMEDFPEYSLRLLGVIREERELESVERACISDL